MNHDENHVAGVPGRSLGRSTIGAVSLLVVVALAMGAARAGRYDLAGPARESVAGRLMVPGTVPMVHRAVRRAMPDRPAVARPAAPRFAGGSRSGGPRRWVPSAAWAGPRPLLAGLIDLPPPRG